jgi:hypothetical protein
MTVVQETIPEALRRDVEAARDWFSQTEEIDFKVTGIVEPQAALDASGRRELRLVLCVGDRCECRSFGVSTKDGRYEVALLDENPVGEVQGSLPAELDPPPGAMRQWLDLVLERHAFVMLVFYRGYW